MSDDNATGAAPRHQKDEVIEDAVVVDEATGAPVVVEEATVTETEPVVATDDPAAVQTDPAAAQTAAPESGHRVVYVQVPTAPKKLGNRGVGALLALAAAVVFTVLYGLIGAFLTGGPRGGVGSRFDFLAQPGFYVPTLFFVIGFVLLVVILNRAGWWAYIVGSLLVGFFVYFGSIGLSLLNAGVVQQTPDAAAVMFRDALTSPSLIIAGVLAREVALWAGAIISRRGRRLRARNLENRAAYERELATTRAEHERAASATAPAA